LRWGETGEIIAKAIPVAGSWDDDRVGEQVPLFAKEMPTFVETTSLKETQGPLKFGRDSQWPIKMTVASAVDEFTSLSVTYSID
jgi:hypothetical protein